MMRQRADCLDPVIGSDLLHIVRLLTRIRSEKPARATTGNALLDCIGVLTNWGFYVLIAGLVLNSPAWLLSAGGRGSSRSGSCARWKGTEEFRRPALRLNTDRRGFEARWRNPVGGPWNGPRHRPPCSPFPSCAGFVEHWRVGTIASQLGVHHSTVERVLGEAGVERERRRACRPVDDRPCPERLEGWASLFRHQRGIRRRFKDSGPSVRPGIRKLPIP